MPGPRGKKQRLLSSEAMPRAAMRRRCCLAAQETPLRLAPRCLHTFPRHKRVGIGRGVSQGFWGEGEPSSQEAEKQSGREALVVFAAGTCSCSPGIEKCNSEHAQSAVSSLRRQQPSGEGGASSRLPPQPGLFSPPNLG